MRHRNRRPVVFVLIVFFLLIASGGFSYQLISGQKSSGSLIPTASFETKKGTLNLYFQSPNYSVRKTSEKAFEGDDFADQRYVFDGSPIRTFYIDYYPSIEALKAKTDYVIDSDGENAGLGSFATDEFLSINGVPLQKTIRYYNPITVTKSGKYIPGKSTFLGSECIYWIDSGRTEALYFWGLAEQGHDTCQFLQQDLGDFKIEIVEK